MLAFPKTAAAVEEIISQHVRAVRWLHSLDNLPIVHVHSLAKPGRTEKWDRQDRVKIDVYARDFDECEDIAEVIRSILVGRSHGTTHGFLDHVWVEAEPYPVNYPVDSVIQYTMTIRVDVRATNL